MLKSVYSDETLSRCHIFQQFSWFSEDKGDISDDVKSGCLKTTRNTNMIDKIYSFWPLTDIENDGNGVRHQARKYQDHSGEGYGKMEGLLKISSHTSWQKAHCVETSHDFSATTNSDPNFLDSVVTDDGPW